MMSFGQTLIWLAILASVFIVNWALTRLATQRWQSLAFGIAATVGALVVTHVFQPWHQNAPWHQPLWAALIGLAGAQYALALWGKRHSAA